MNSKADNKYCLAELIASSYYVQVSDSALSIMNRCHKQHMYVAKFTKLVHITESLNSTRDGFV